jgi:predicted nuclease of restriction endonuclease-like RecB superfamily
MMTEQLLKKYVLNLSVIEIFSKSQISLFFINSKYQGLPLKIKSLGLKFEINSIFSLKRPTR